MRYDYKCKSCGEIEEKDHSIKETPSYNCPKCQSPMERMISFNPTGFVFKGGTITIHMREKDARKKKSLEMKNRQAKGTGVKVRPNIAGVETGSWADAQKMAKEANMNHESFTPWVEKEKKEKKGIIIAAK